MTRPVKRRSGCRSFLIFVIGMITGVVVFVGAIAGTVYVLLTSYTLKDIQDMTGAQIPLDPEGELMNKTLFALGQELFNLISNISSIPIQELINRYGIPIPSDIMGIDISPLFAYPVTEAPGHINEIIQGISLSTIGGLASIDFASYNLPILSRNLDRPINEAIDALLSSFGGDNMSMRSLSENFGIDLAGENIMLRNLSDLPINSISEAIDYIELWEIADIDFDKFIPLGAQTLYVKTERYEEVDDVGVSAPDSLRHINGVDENGLVYAETRFVQNEDLTYSVRNGEPEDGVTYFRFFEYEPYDAIAHADATEFYVKAYANKFIDDGEGNFVPKEAGFFRLNDLFADDTGAPLADYANIAAGTPLYLFDGTDYILADEFGLSGAPDADSRLDTDYTGALQVHIGTSDITMQIIAHSNINSLSGIKDELLTLELGQLLDIDLSPDSEDPLIMRSLAETPINGLSGAINTLTLDQAVEIDGDSPMILQSLATSPIVNLSDSINALTLGEAIEITAASHVVLRRLADTHITEIGTEMTDVINTLMLKELVEIQQYDVYSRVESSGSILLARAEGSAAQYLYVFDTNGMYYCDGTEFKPLDLAYYSNPGDYSRYSKRSFSEFLVYDENGTHVQVNGYAELYDDENPEHDGLARYDLVTGYIASTGQILPDISGSNYVLDSDLNYVDGDGTDFVSLDGLYQKSAKMLVSLGNVSVENTATAFSTMTMDDILDIETDSFFDDASIRNSTPSALPAAIAARIADATIGQLVRWGELDLHPAVTTVLENITVSDFFSGLLYDPISGTVYFDLP